MNGSDSDDGILSWDDYFMGIAILSARRSKDPNTQVGACIVNNDKRIISTGYNGFPDTPTLEQQGGNDVVFDWDKERKHYFVLHAEMNAILNRNQSSVEGSTMYVTLYPCVQCTKLIVQSRIKKVYYFHRKPSFEFSPFEFNIYNYEESKHTFEKVGVIIKHLEVSDLSILQMKPKMSRKYDYQPSE